MTHRNVCLRKVLSYENVEPENCPCIATSSQKDKTKPICINKPFKILASDHILSEQAEHSYAKGLLQRASHINPEAI